MDEDEVLVCSLSEFDQTSRKRLTVKDRDIFILKDQGNFYALDSFCYHAGGPLYRGDIEELGGTTCMVCPWHKYKVCIKSGESIYQAIDPHDLSKPPVWKSSGIKQRTHTVIVKEGHLYVKFSSVEQTLESDHYNNEEFRTKNKLQ